MPPTDDLDTRIAQALPCYFDNPACKSICGKTTTCSNCRSNRPAVRALIDSLLLERDAEVAASVELMAQRVRPWERELLMIAASAIRPPVSSEASED